MLLTNFSRFHDDLEFPATVETLGRRSQTPLLPPLDLRLPRGIVDVIDVHVSPVSRSPHEDPAERQVLGGLRQKVRPTVVLGEYLSGLVVAVAPSDVPVSEGRLG